MAAALACVFSLAAAAAAFLVIVRRLTPLMIRRGGADLSDASLGDLPGLIALVLPRRPRIAWNLFWLAVCTAVLGTPHFLALRQVALAAGDAWLWYGVTLPWWLALMTLPASAWASHRAARRQDS